MKIAAVTGGAQGIGRAIVLRFAAAGYALSIADSDAAAGQEILSMLRERGADATFRHVDIGKEIEAAGWVRHTVETLGCPDLLVNNAGIMVRKPFLDLPLADFDRVIAVNLRSAFVCSQAVGREMVRHAHSGSIVNIASTRAFMSEPDTESYSASKGGLVALTHAMAISLSKHRIRVNCNTRAGSRRATGSTRRGLRHPTTRNRIANSIRSAASASRKTLRKPVSTWPNQRASRPARISLSMAA